VITLVATLAAGWFVGGPTPAERVATSLVSGVRAVGPPLAVARVSFGDRPGAADAIVAFGLLSFPTVGWRPRSCAGKYVNRDRFPARPPTTAETVVEHVSP
jgi:hypothetical protein